ncbi:MAG TPA: metal-dependent hydrolase [Gammaproteobacteria bacterium]|nr:metal-dependent hydrolase [Gammaproteobacteria bacterium]
MDPVAHTFTGAALAAAGLRRTTPLACAALLLGANAPDVDVLASFAGGYEAIAFRRGWTHGVLALAIWPFALAGVLLLWDRWFRRRRDPTAAPARAGPLLLLAALAVVTHPTLDWLNNYGLRWLMPFDGRWFYGDALFIVDPWIWLTLGGASFLTFSRSRLALARWTVFWSSASLVVLASTALVPPFARVLWVLALVVLVAARALGRNARPRALERAAQAALGVAAVYIVAMVALSAAARVEVRETLAARGIGDVEQVMVAPAAADPFGGAVVAVTPGDYYTGRWNWLADPRLALGTERIPRPRGPVFDAAAQAPEARDFLSWARFPSVELEPAADGGTVVRFFDVRYRSGERLDGPTVHLDRGLGALPAR